MKKKKYMMYSHTDGRPVGKRTLLLASRLKKKGKNILKKNDSLLKSYARK